MKQIVILSSVVFVASTVMAAIDDPPRLVVWAGTVQFVVTLVAAAIFAWWRPSNR